MRQPHDRSMRLSSTLSWLVDAAAETAGVDRLLAELGAHLVEDGLPLAGCAPGGLAAAPEASPPDDAGKRWLTGIAAGMVHQDGIGQGRDGPLLSWVGPRPFTQRETDQLRQAARFAAAPLAVLAARATFTAAFEAYLGRRT